MEKSKQQKLDFYIELDREIRNHPLHTQQDELYRLHPWTIEAVKHHFKQYPDKKHTFFRYIRKKDDSNSLSTGLMRMANELKRAPNYVFDFSPFPTAFS